MRMPALSASLATSGAVGVASDLTSAPSARVRMLPVHPDLVGLFPLGGLRRGSTVSVRGSTSLLLALLAEATARASWAAVVGLPDVGVVAAAELGVAVDRLALVRRPGPEHPRVIAALLDGMDLVVTARGRLTDAQARRLSARARHRGAVLLTSDPWPASDMDLHCTTTHWSGLGEGHGHLAYRETTIRSRGRGAATRPVHATLHLPGSTGAIAPAPVPRLAPTPHLRRVRPASPPRDPPVGIRKVPVSSSRVSRSGPAGSRIPAREPPAPARVPASRTPRPLPEAPVREHVPVARVRRSRTERAPSRPSRFASPSRSSAIGQGPARPAEARLTLPQIERKFET